MARLGTSNFREKEKSYLVQEDTWKVTVEKEKIIEEFGSHPHGGHQRPTTYADVALREGPTVSTAHSSHAAPDTKVVAAERPAGKSSMIGLEWGIR
mmetsp:Transcript_81241/g.181772  ORF Transcript_81241/g.181772 Transcript_81241/m.181772 type:complete len:96 (+) Transcript_81241:95-382(+)